MQRVKYTEIIPRLRTCSPTSAPGRGTVRCYEYLVISRSEPLWSTSRRVSEFLQLDRGTGYLPFYPRVVSQGSMLQPRPVRLQQRLGYVGDQLTQECLCFLFGNTTAVILFCLCFVFLHSR